MRQFLTLSIVILASLVCSQSYGQLTDWGRSSNETAWAYGDYELRDYVKSNRWGWFSEIEINQGEWRRFPIYASAGNNSIEKGTLVGTIGIQYSHNLNCGSYAVVFMNEGYELKSVHYQAAHTIPTTSAPGKFNRNSNLFITPEDTGGIGAVFYMPAFTFDGSPIYTAFHAVVTERK